MNRIVVLLLLFLGASFAYISNYSETGRASFYASHFHGKRTSSGEVFKHDNLTGAHKTLPFGTLVKVTNLSNDSTVILKINDRLGKKSASIIDVSLKAAKQLNFTRKGHTKVKLVVL